MSHTTSCPYCGSHIVVNESNSDTNSVNHNFEVENFYGSKSFKFTSRIVICTNPECKMHVVEAELDAYIKRKIGENEYSSKLESLNNWQLLPDSMAKQFPIGIIPNPIIEDYTEACKIASLSPKASATLLRRCLQGMIRDFYGIVKGTLKEEIDELNKVIHDTDIIEAIETLRKTGNIGAHMEKDINLIVDIDEGEVDQLKWLIEFLIEEWYIKRHEKNLRLKGLKTLGATKQAQKTPTP